MTCIQDVSVLYYYNVSYIIIAYLTYKHTYYYDDIVQKNCDNNLGTYNSTYERMYLYISTSAYNIIW